MEMLLINTQKQQTTLNVVTSSNKHTHTRLLKYSTIYVGFKTKEYKKMKIQKKIQIRLS